MALSPPRPLAGRFRAIAGLAMTALRMIFTAIIWSLVALGTCLVLIWFAWMLGL